MRLVLVSLLLLLTFPLMVLAQPDDTPIDPYGELSETLTHANITISYPAGMRPDTSNPSQIGVYFGDARDNFISILILAQNNILADDLAEASATIFALLAEAYGDDAVYDAVATDTRFIGYPAIYFPIATTEMNLEIFVYVVAINGDFYVFALATPPDSPSADVQMSLMVRVARSMTIEDVAVFASPQDIPARLAPFALIDRPQEASLFMGRVTTYIPDGWVIEPSYGWVISSQEASDKVMSGTPLEADDIILQIYVPDAVRSLDIDVIAPLPVLYEFLKDYPSFTVAYYENLPYETYMAHVVDESLSQDGYIITRQLGIRPDDVVIIIILTPDFDAHEATIIAIINDLVPFTE